MLLHGQTRHTVGLAAANRGHHTHHRHPNHSCYNLSRIRDRPLPCVGRQQICAPCQLPAPALDVWSCCMRGLPTHPHRCRLLGLVLMVGGVGSMVVVMVVVVL